MVKLIVGQAEERLKAQQTAIAALDQRSTQAVAFQFAAATASTGFSFILLEKAAFAALVAAFCAMVFLAGSLTAMRGLRKTFHHLPGVQPSWWQIKSGERLILETAQTWHAKCLEEKLNFNESEVQSSAEYLNLSLRIGVFGGGVLVVASILASLYYIRQ